MVPTNTPIGTRCRIIASIRRDPHEFNIGEEVVTKERPRMRGNAIFHLACTSTQRSLQTWYVDLAELELIEPISIESSSPLASLFSHSKLFSQ